MALPYHYPEWAKKVADNYRANPDNWEKHFKGLSLFIVFSNIAQPELGIDEQIYHYAQVDDGVLVGDANHLSKAEAEEKADFILTGPLDVWKRIILKEEAFVSAFLNGKIKLEKGFAPKIVQLGPKSPALIECFSGVDTEWPDEMSPERIEEYRAGMKEFRARLGV